MEFIQTKTNADAQINLEINKLSNIEVYLMRDNIALSQRYCLEKQCVSLRKIIRNYKIKRGDF